MAFQKGVSGNPKGRPRGASKQQALRRSIQKDAQKIIDSLLTEALAGDVGAAKVLLDKALPGLKAVSAAVPIDGIAQGTLKDRGESIMAAIGDGKITPDQGQQMIASLAGLAKIIETDDLITRIAALEEAQDADD